MIEIFKKLLIYVIVENVVHAHLSEMEGFRKFLFRLTNLILRHRRSYIKRKIISILS